MMMTKSSILKICIVISFFLCLFFCFGDYLKKLKESRHIHQKLLIGFITYLDLIACRNDNSVKRDKISDLKWHFHPDKQLYYSSVDELYIEQAWEKKARKERMRKRKSRDESMNECVHIPIAKEANSNSRRVHVYIHTHLHIEHYHSTRPTLLLILACIGYRTRENSSHYTAQLYRRRVQPCRNGVRMYIYI
jgi:hypothetical protein